MPAALVVACCSAIPTSYVRPGNLSANRSSPVGPSIAAVIATTSGRSSPIRTSSSAKAPVHEGPPALTGLPVSGSMMPTPWKSVRLVLLRRCVAVPLVRDGVHDHGALEGLGAIEGELHLRLVMAVNRSDVLEAEILEEPLWRHDVLDALLHAVERPVDGVPHHGSPVQHLLAPVHEPLVTVGRAQGRQVVGQATDRRRVRASVVVHDDDEGAVGVGDVVERLPGHAPGERAVADDRDDMVLAEEAPLLPGLGEPVRVRQCGRCVGVLHEVVDALGAARIPRKAVPLTELVEAGRSARQDLVDVRLVARCPR